MRLLAAAALIAVAAACAEGQSATPETLILREVSIWLPAQQFMPAGETCLRAAKMRGPKRADPEEYTALICMKKGEYLEFMKLGEYAQVAVTAKLTDAAFPVGLMRLHKYEVLSAPKVIPKE